MQKVSVQRTLRQIEFSSTIATVFAIEIIYDFTGFTLFVAVMLPLFTASGAFSPVNRIVPVNRISSAHFVMNR